MLLCNVTSHQGEAKLHPSLSLLIYAFIFPLSPSLIFLILVSLFPHFILSIVLLQHFQRCQIKQPISALFFKWTYNGLHYFFLFHCLQLKGRRTSHLSQDKDGQPHDPLLLQVVHKGHRRRLGAAAGSARLMAITDCVDNGTQTDISFQNFLNGDRESYPSSGSPMPPPSPPLAQLVEPYLLNDL